MTLPRLAILASGNGSNFHAIADAIRAGTLHAQIAGLLCNRADAYALTRAAQLHIPSVVITNSKNADELGDAIIAALAPFTPDLICLAGFMRIISPRVLHTFPRIVNIHPALLPQFPGLRAIERAFAVARAPGAPADAQTTGVTVHWVDHGVDTGNIILQERVEIFPHDTVETLTTRIHAVEHRLYPTAIQKIL